MTLHDRGKALVKKGDLKTAAQMFLRAESEGFSKWYYSTLHSKSARVTALQPVTNRGVVCHVRAVLQFG